MKKGTCTGHALLLISERTWKIVVFESKILRIHLPNLITTVLLQSRVRVRKIQTTTETRLQVTVFILLLDWIIQWLLYLNPYPPATNRDFQPQLNIRRRISSTKRSSQKSKRKSETKFEHLKQTYQLSPMVLPSTAILKQK